MFIANYIQYSTLIMLILYTSFDSINLTQPQLKQQTFNKHFLFKIYLNSLEFIYEISKTKKILFKNNFTNTIR